MVRWKRRWIGNGGIGGELQLRAEPHLVSSPTLWEVEDRFPRRCHMQLRDWSSWVMVCWALKCLIWTWQQISTAETAEPLVLHYDLYDYLRSIMWRKVEFLFCVAVDVFPMLLENASARAAFDRRMTSVVGGWCCWYGWSTGTCCWLIVVCVASGLYVGRWILFSLFIFV